jgi:hypothetical protein
MTRRVRSLLLFLGLTLTAAPALAQNPGAPPPGGEESSGRPLDGYLATGALAFAILFAVGKTARRS